MALIITVAQQKGGAGKTMLAANLAAAWAPTHRVALLDIDPQRSLKRWHALRTANPKAPAIAFSDVSGWRLAAEIDRLQREADIIIIDTPPQIDADATRAIRAASLVLIPIQPSPPDLWAAEGTLILAAAERRRVAARFAAYGLGLNPDAKLRDLSPVQTVRHPAQSGQSRAAGDA